MSRRCTAAIEERHTRETATGRQHPQRRNGVVNNTTGDFVVSDGKATAGAVFIFASAGRQHHQLESRSSAASFPRTPQSATHVAGAISPALRCGSSGGKKLHLRYRFRRRKDRCLRCQIPQDNRQRIVQRFEPPRRIRPQQHIQNLGRASVCSLRPSQGQSMNKASGASFDCQAIPSLPSRKPLLTVGRFERDQPSSRLCRHRHSCDGEPFSAPQHRPGDS